MANILAYLAANTTVKSFVVNAHGEVNLIKLALGSKWQTH
jgi:hypothetical protein